MLLAFIIFCHAFISVIVAQSEVWETTPCLKHLEPDNAHDASANPCRCNGVPCGSNEIVMGSGNAEQKMYNVFYNKRAYIPHKWMCRRDWEMASCATPTKAEPLKECYCIGSTSDACGATNGWTSPHMRTTEFVDAKCNAKGGLQNTACPFKGSNYPPINCIHTNDLAKTLPFWYVDMGRTYTISQVFWIPRELKSTIQALTDNDRGLYMWLRWKGTVVLVDAKICDVWNDYPVPDSQLSNLYRGKENIAMTVTCRAPIHGQFARLQRTPHPTGSFSMIPIQACEIQSYACKPGYYISGNRIIGFNAGNFMKENFPTCAQCPAEVSQCRYGCDNFYGCLTDYIVPYNLGLWAEAVFASSGVDARKAVDGVSFLTVPDFCFESRQKSESNAHYWKIRLHHVSAVKNVTVTGNHAQQPLLSDIDVVVGRNADLDPSERCVLLNGAFPTTFSTPYHHGRSGPCGTCSDARTIEGCPRGRYVAVRAPPSLSIMRLCEVEIWGIRIREVEAGGDCGDCPLVVCEPLAIVIPAEKKCKSVPGGKCKLDEHCLYGSRCENSVCKIPKDVNCQNYKDQCTGALVCNQQNLCKATIYGSCSIDTDCASPTKIVPDDSVVCDFLESCKLAVGASCLEPDVCVAGTTCKSGTCTTCNPTQTNADPTNKKCIPIFYKKACTSAADCTPTAPVCTNGFCVCENNLLPALADFTCGKTPGSRCTGDDQCSTPWKCSGGICKIPHLEYCRSAIQYCDGTDKCDEFNYACKAVPTAPCVHDTDCFRLSKCVNIEGSGKQCRLPVSHPCDPTKEECNVVAMLACDPKTSKCALMAGASCDPESEIRKCHSGLSCTRAMSGFYKCNVARKEACTSTQQCSAEDECNSEKKCTGRPGSPCTYKNNDECAPDSLCDRDRKCRYKADAVCQYDAYCTLGAACDKQSGNCSCISGRTLNPATGTCDLATQDKIDDPTPKVVGALCEPSGVRCVDNAYCDSGMKVCLCTKGYGVTANASCLPGSATACVSSNDTTKELCALGLVCDLGYQKCGIKIGYPCIKYDSLRSHCDRGSLCDDYGFCTLDLNAECKEYTESCREGLVCSPFGKCRIDVKPKDEKNELCYATYQCVPGSYCDINQEKEDGSGTCTCNTTRTDMSGTSGCHLTPKTLGGECDGSSSCTSSENQECAQAPDKKKRCLCAKDHEAEETALVCKLARGAPCTANKGDCIPGTVCDTGTCKIDIGQACTGFGNGVCKTGLTCIEDICKVTKGGACTDSLMCETNHICDPLYTCKWMVGELCSVNSDCSLGGICALSKCQCNTVLSTESNGMCEPKRTMLGAKCDKDGDCKTDSKCSRGRCACLDDAFLSDFDTLTCISVAKSTLDDEERKSSNLFVVLLCILALVAMVAITAVYSMRTMTQQTKQEAVRRESMGRMELMKTTGLAADQMPMGHVKAGTRLAVVPELESGVSTMASSAAESSVADSTVDSRAPESRVVESSVAPSKA